MRIEAILFVNWIFWAALSAGTLLVVGITERLGGTTRGYRLFMAWLLVAFAAILVASELALPVGVEASGTASVRRPLTLAFAAGAAAYLVASLAVRLLTSDRWATLATGIGMMVATLLFSGRGPGGSVIVPDSSLGIVWTISVPILIAIVVGLPDRIRFRPEN